MDKKIVLMSAKKQDIQIMTYDKIINILLKQNVEGLETLNKIKLLYLMNAILF